MENVIMDKMLSVKNITVLAGEGEKSKKIMPFILFMIEMMMLHVWNVLTSSVKSTIFPIKLI